MKRVSDWSLLLVTGSLLMGLSAPYATAQPASIVPLPRGAVGETSDDVVRNVDSTKVRFPVICATNRKWTGSGYSALDRDTASDEPGFVLRYCVMNKATHKLGQRDDVTFDSVKATQADLDKLLGPTPDGASKRYLVFVHGFTSNFEQSFQAVSQLTFDINRHYAPVLFSWPSGSNVMTDYSAARDNTRDAGYKLAKTLEVLQARAGKAIEIDLVAHSLGSEVVMDGLKELDTTPFESIRPKILFRNIVFIAPDVSEEDFKRNVQRPVFGQTRTTLYTNAKDPVLAIPAAAVNYNERVGLKVQFSDLRVENIDVTPLYPQVPSAAGHTSILNQPVGLMDLFMMLKHDLRASQRNLIYTGKVWQLRK